MNQSGDADSDLDSNLVVLGQIGKVHGIKGWLKLRSFTEPPENILQYRTLTARSGGQVKTLEVDESHQQGKGLVVHFTGYDDPEQARELTGFELTVNSQDLPPLDEGTYYWHQLQGLRVVNHHAQDFGVVARLMETGANDVLVVHPDEKSLDAQERLIPYLPGSVVLRVDLEAGQMTVNWEADYLTE